MAIKPSADTFLFTKGRPLTSEQRSHILRRLLEERASIMRRLARFGSDSNESRSVNCVPLHMADVGSDTIQESLDTAFASRDTQTLVDIDDASRRLYGDPARFGTDERTGVPIAFERLDIIPWTRRA